MISKLLKLHNHFSNWYIRMFERLGFLTGDITYKLRQFPISFTFESRKLYSPLWILEDMLYNDPYNDPTLTFGRAPLVVDVGANVGFFSLLQAVRWPEACVYAYEAHPKNYEYLCQNIRENRLSDRVHAFQCAVVGEKTTSTITLYENDGDAGSHSVFFSKAGSSERPFEAPALSFREIYSSFASSPTVDLLKMDVEGAEYEILRHSQDVLRHVRYLSMEHHVVEGESVKDLRTFLENNGFSVTDFTPTVWHCVNKNINSMKSEV